MEEKIRYFPLVLIGLCALVFVVQSIVLGFTDSLLLDSSLMLERPWTIVTSTFLHGSLSHLAFNMFALFIFGLLLEKFVGSKKFLAIYFVSGIIASLAAAAFYPQSLGASGAIYGVIGALAAIRPKMTIWTYGVPMPMVAAAGFYLLLDLAGLFYPSTVANAAHVAGLITGVIIGWSLRASNYTEKNEKTSEISNKEFNNWEDQWMSLSFFGRKKPSMERKNLL